MEAKRLKIAYIDDDEDSSTDSDCDNFTVCSSETMSDLTPDKLSGNEQRGGTLPGTFLKYECCCRSNKPFESSASTSRGSMCFRCQTWHKMMATSCKAASNSTGGNSCNCCNHWLKMLDSSCETSDSNGNFCCDRWGKIMVPACESETDTTSGECECCKTWLGIIMASYPTNPKSSSFCIVLGNFLQVNTGNPADVKFAFESYEHDEAKRLTIAAHKDVLSSKSPVFEAMLTRWDTSKPILIATSEVNAFTEFLRFIYKKEVNMSADNYLQLVNLSHMYQVDELFKICQTKLQSYCNQNNCVSIYLTTSLLDVKEMKETAWKVLMKNIKTVMLGEEFILLSKEALVEILKLDDINFPLPDEKIIKDSCTRWARKKCEDLKLEETQINLQSVLGEAFRLIRFTLLEKSEYSFSREDPLLTEEQKCWLLAYKLGTEESIKRKLTWIENMKPRQNFTFQALRFRTNGVRREKSWIYRSKKWDRIGFSVNEDVLITGIACYGNSLSSNHETPTASTYDVAIRLLKYDREDFVLGKGSRVVTNNMGENFRVNFDKPVYVVSGQKYIIASQTKGPRSFFGEDGCAALRVNCHDYPVVFHFMEAPRFVHANSTGVFKGVIPSLYFIFVSSSDSDVEVID